MKICHVNMFYLPTFGGVEKVMEELALRQIKEGHEVHVYCCDSDKYKRLKEKYVEIGGVKIHRLRYWFRLSFNTFFWPSLLWILPGKEFDVIHSHVSGHAYVLFSGIAARLTGAKHIHTTHCPWTDAFRPGILRIPLFFNNLIFNKLSFKFCDKIISITPWELRTLKKWVERKKIVVIPNGMDKILFKKVKRNNFKKEWGLKGKLVLFFGRLNPTKGPEHLAKVAKEIVNERKNICFAFVGPDEGKMEEVKEIVKGEKQIVVTGPIKGKDKIAEMFQASDVYVLPSYREGLPLTLFEAMASGLPVVASPCNGVPYEMNEPENGFFVNYGDVKNLKKRILKVLDNPKLAKKMSENNIKKTREYTWDKIYKKTMELYRKK